MSRNGVRNEHILEPTAFSLVCADDADVKFRSCDGILFKVHRSNLVAHSEGFSPPPGTSSHDEIVALPENGDTLDLLFQFMSPQRQPDLSEIMFKQLAELAEAAEKYQVFSAMTICNVHMTYVVSVRDGTTAITDRTFSSDAYSKHPFEVMLYAMRHGYGKLMDKAERKVLEVSPTLAFECFTPEVYIAWVSYTIKTKHTSYNDRRCPLFQTRYHGQWLDLLASLREQCMRQMQSHSHTAHQATYLLFFVSQLNTPASLLDWKRIFRDTASLKFKFEQSPGYAYTVMDANVTLCQTCESGIQGWNDGAMEQSIRQMRKLSSFL